MGFEVGQPAELAFEEGHPLHGCHVRVWRAMTIREFNDTRKTIAALTVSDQLTDEEVTEHEAAFRLFGDRFIADWDFTVRGQEVPANGEGMIALPFTVQRDLFNAWITAVSQPDPNSNAASEPGEPVAELVASRSN